MLGEPQSKFSRASSEDLANLIDVAISEVKCSRGRLRLEALQQRGGYTIR